MFPRAMAGFLLALMLSACTVQQMATSQAGPAAQAVDPAAARLADAAVSVSHALRDLAEVEQAANPQAEVHPTPNPNSYGMGHLASMDWTGPLEPLISRLADSSGYTLKVLGTRPAIPIVVTIHASDVPVGDILQDAGYQASNRADVMVFPSTKVIEIRYTKE